MGLKIDGATSMFILSARTAKTFNYTAQARMASIKPKTILLFQKCSVGILPVTPAGSRSYLTF